MHVHVLESPRPEKIFSRRRRLRFDSIARIGFLLPLRRLLLHPLWTYLVVELHTYGASNP
jgi:hypothetical protein